MHFYIIIIYIVERDTHLGLLLGWGGSRLGEGGWVGQMFLVLALLSSCAHRRRRAGVFYQTAPAPGYEE